MQHHCLNRKISCCCLRCGGTARRLHALGSDWLECSLRVCRFQRVVSNSARSRKSDVHNGGPSLKLVMSGTMEQVGSSDRDSSSSGLDHGKRRVTVYQVIGN